MALVSLAFISSFFAWLFRFFVVVVTLSFVNISHRIA